MIHAHGVDAYEPGEATGTAYHCRIGPADFCWYDADTPDDVVDAITSYYTDFPYLIEIQELRDDGSTVTVREIRPE